MHTESDEDLVKRIASGDRLAMKVLFSRHQVRVYRFVLRLVRDETLAEDVISDVFMDLWRQADRFEARASVATWLLAIARNKAWSLLRKRRDAELDEDYAGTIEDESDGPEIVLQKQDKGRRSAPASNAFLPTIARSSTSSTTTRPPSRRSRGSSAFPRTPSKPGFSMPARSWARCSRQPVSTVAGPETTGIMNRGRAAGGVA